MHEGIHLGLKDDREKMSQALGRCGGAREARPCTAQQPAGGRARLSITRPITPPHWPPQNTPCHAGT